MKTSTAVILLIVIVALGAAAFFFVDTSPVQMPGENATSTPNMHTYINTKYGFQFQYPDTYTLQEREVGNAERYHTSITLIDSAALANVPQNGEGPPSITVDVFQNNIDTLSVDGWIKNTSASNFKLSPDGLLGSTTVAGAPALHYMWDGLYRGESFVFSHRDNIIMMSVTYNSTTDQIRMDFERIKSSIMLQSQ